MQKDYYQNILYPFQSRILKVIGHLPVDFYLSGGTALGRAYLNHRYSDDLEFAINSSPDFKKQIETVLDEFVKYKIKFQRLSANKRIVRCIIENNRAPLKVDFINDVKHRYGTPVITPLFKRTDHVLNILSGKISALKNSDPNDVVDIVFISKKFNFNWENILNDSIKKDDWVTPENVCEILNSFTYDKFDQVMWLSQPSSEKLMSDINTITSELVKGSPNSLCK